MVSVVMGLGLLVPPSSPYFQDSDKPWHIDIATLSMLMISVLCIVVLAIVVVCYTFILRTIKRLKDENGTIHNEHGQRHRAMSVANSNSGRKMQAVGRHKYIYVIGTVLIVDLLFLCPYSGIQLVAFPHINHLIEITHSSTLIRWWLQVLIGVHSVCQPLCYFRMTEFRRLACCVTRPWSSRSCSVLNKSFVNTRSVIRDDELLDPMDSPQIREPLLNMTHDPVDCKLGICASVVSTRAHSVANNG
ncbi:unnamed protein product, partial [Cylicocyclus nassatus]